MQVEVVSNSCAPSFGTRAALRNSGLDVVGDVPWGTHFCQFYATADDLLETLGPYFAAGLAANEFCFWIASAPLSAEQARIGLRRFVPDIEKYFARGQIEIIDHDQWYTREGKFEADRVLQAWLDKLEHVSRCGFDGLRLTGNTFCLEETDWSNFTHYESEVSRILLSKPILAVCSYALEKCGFAEILDVIARHEFVLVRRNGRWETVKTFGHLRTQRALEASEERFRLLVDNARDYAFFTLDPDGCIADWNEGARRLAGWRAEEIVGRDVSVLHPSVEDARRALALAAARGEHREEGERVRKDGSSFHADALITALRDRKGRLRGYANVVRDVSERARRRQEEARFEKLRADRLDLLAQMATGVAHEINQPLSAIATYLSAARRVLRRQPARAESSVDAILDSAIAQVMRAGQIIGRLRGFISHGEPDKTLQSLHGVIHDACAFTDLDARSVKVEVKLELHAADDWVIVDRLQMRQVLVSLKRNAIEAMHASEKRQLTISTSLVEGGMVRTDIADTGAGLSEDLSSRLFEPFQTTKEHGLGVGLSVSRSIIEAHYGNLWAEANPGGGTILSFTLPLAGRHKDQAPDQA
jgi:two-component system sensor kinase FixL